MITRRPSDTRGYFDHQWLKTHHSFSFAEYYDPAYVQWGPLRVLNEDVVAPGAGFPTHPHQNMEIVTYVISGAIAHEDSMGNSSTIQRGEIQRMTAGTGVFHSEANPLDDTPLHLFQVWFLPAQMGLEPGYEQKAWQAEAATNALLPLVVPVGQAQDTQEANPVEIHQDAYLLVSLLETGQRVERSFSGRKGWVQVASGSVTLNGTALNAGDGAAIEEETDIVFEAVEPSEFLVFDLCP